MQEKSFEQIRDIAEDNKSEKQVNMDELYKINNDIVAWIKIDNTNIDYPVMQTKERPQFYLRKNFYKQYSIWGTPFLSEGCNIKMSDNLIIYGHHIEGLKMFGELQNYKKREFYQKHKYIDFYTMEEKGKYEIIAVFRINANDEFQYYKFINANSKSEFSEFMYKCKKLSFYQIEENAQYGDKLLTLSTCDYSMKDGRFVIVAKKV